MNGPTRLLIRLAAAAALLFIVTAGISAQVNLRPTPPPVVTAENEAWYRGGEPLIYAGTPYYPAGPAIHFIGDEMVRSGFYQGVPLYARTTIEPYSVVFVPVGGGMMQPYERRRSGDLAGTSGSSVPSFQIEIPSSTPADPAVIQAPAPPVVTSPPVPDASVTLPPQLSEPRPVESREVARPSQPAPRVNSVGTSGRVANSRRAAPRARSLAPNGIFVEYDNARWYSSGPPESPDPQTLNRVGEWHGFPVYAARGSENTIYIPIAQGLDALAPYSKRH